MRIGVDNLCCLYTTITAVKQANGFVNGLWKSIQQRVSDAVQYNKRRKMNRSSKGFGLTGVAIAVVFMLLTAVFSTSAQSSQTEADTTKQRVLVSTTG